MRRQVDVQWVRRTFTRVAWLARRVKPEDLAEWLMRGGIDNNDRLHILIGAAFLHDLNAQIEARDKQAEAEGEPERTCIVCNGTIWVGDRSDARYCSPRCRQRAYRARVTDRQSERTTDPSPIPVGDTSRDLSDVEGVTR